MEGKLNEELNKLKSMTFKEKLEYIWDYYNFHIVAAVIILVILFSALNNFVFNPQKKTYLGVAIYGPYVLEDIVDNMDYALTMDMVENKDEYKVYVTNFYLDESNPEFYSANVQKFFAMAFAQDLDIFIAAKDMIIQMAASDIILHLSELDGIDFPEEEMLYAYYEDDPETSLPFGIPLKNCEFLRDFGLNVDELYLGVMINTIRQDETVEAINYMISGK